MKNKIRENKIDIIIKAKHIFDGINNRIFSGYILIKGNTIFKVGNINIKDYTYDKLIICEEELVMPSFIDTHTHFITGAIFVSSMFCTEIEKAKSEEECVNMLIEFDKKNPGMRKITGRGWLPSNWANAPLPTKKSLDKAFPNKPVYLMAADGHTFWLNSKALEECNITYKELTSGEIGRLDNGELSGLLFEHEAFEPAAQQAYSFTNEEHTEMCKNYMKFMNSFGITSISEMSARNYNEESEKLYNVPQLIEKENGLTCRVHIYYSILDKENFKTISSKFNNDDSSMIKFAGLKGFVDGVSSTHTSLLIEPYEDIPTSFGENVPLQTKEKFRELTIAANSLNMPVRLHCIGDGAVRLALDIFENSQTISGNIQGYNTIEHIELIHKEDIPRFKELNVIASFQPTHLEQDQKEQYIRFGNERAKECGWKIKSILDSNGIVAFGSDFPVVSPNPFHAIQIAVTRKGTDGQEVCLNSEERISVHQALVAYTSDAAKAYGRDDIGLLANGKLADLVILNKNIFTVKEDKIKDIYAVKTICNGKLVYEV